ncbi:ankyrin repeat-containing domain protein [Nemania sp. FL0031]|nr:ankyrin repeat-containing domain protein [Nemania sp. FL0031]
MATQLSLDVLLMLAEEMVVCSKPQAALNFSLVSRRVHDFTYPLILKADVLSNVFTDDCDCRINCYKNKTIYHVSSLSFFIKSDNPALVENYLRHIGMEMDTVVHFPGEPERCGNILFLAVTSGATSVVEFLLKAGAKFGRRTKYPKIYTHPLTEAIDNNHAAITKLLLEYGALPDYFAYHGHHDDRSKDQRIIDWIATSRTSVAMVETLISHCSDVIHADSIGRTAIHKLVSQYMPMKGANPRGKVANFRGKIELLVQAGVNIDAISDGGERVTALDMACRQVFHYPVRVLLELGASTGGAAVLNGEHFNASTSYTPLRQLLIPAEYSWKWDFPTRTLEVWLDELGKSVKLLLDYGQLQGHPGRFDRGQSAKYFRLCTSLRLDLSKLWAILIDGVLDVHSRNQFGQTLLSKLASRCHGEDDFVDTAGPYWKPNLVRALIAAGSDPNTVDDSGMTPVHWAIFYGDFELVKLLIELGSNPLKEVDGSTPVHYAFGKPFPRRGAVAHKVHSKLLDSLTAKLRYSKYNLKIDETSHVMREYSEGKWHPLLSCLRDPLIRRVAKPIVATNENRFFSIMALLFPFSESMKDENGHTPRDIAEEAGILTAGETVKLCIVDREDTPPEGVAFSEYLASIQEEHLTRAPRPFDKSFPMALCGPDRWTLRPAFLSLVTTKNGMTLYVPAKISPF